MSKFKYVIYACTLFIAPLFFCSLAYLGSGFENDIDTAGYIEITLLFDFISIYIALRSIRSKQKIILALISLMFVIIYVIEGSHADFYLKYYFAFSLPSGFIAIDLSESKQLEKLCKWIEVISIYIAGALIYSLPTILFNRSLTFEYQSYSYYCSFVYLNTLFLVLFGDSYHRFTFSDYKIYKVMRLAILTLMPIASLISGGRGGFLVIIVGTIILIRRSGTRLFKNNLISSIIGIALIAIFIHYIPSELFEFALIGSERTFSFISGSHIDMSATSGRDDIYSLSLDYIMNNPIIGCGFFKYVDIVKYHGYPHNFVLEVLLQGGIIYFVVSILFIYKTLKKYNCIKLYDNNNSLFLTLAILPCVQLFFTGSYITVGMFWFVIFYINSYKL